MQRHHRSPGSTQGSPTFIASPLNDPDARTEAAEILRGLIDRVSVKPDGDGYVIEVVGDIVKRITLPGGCVPAPFASPI